MNVERIMKIVDWLESGAVHETAGGTKIGFDMSYWDSNIEEEDLGCFDNPEFPHGHCGTAMCIGGAAQQFFGTDTLEDDEGYAASLLGLPKDLAYKLFYPWNYDWYTDAGQTPLTPKYMAGVLRRLIKTGELVG